MQISRHLRSIALNIIALTILFVGYLLTTGTGLFDSDGSKAIFRFSSMLLLIGNSIVNGPIKIKFILSIIFIFILAMFSRSPLAANIIFLLLITASLYRLNAKELSFTLFIPVVIVVIVHTLLLFTGNISTEIMEIGERMRTTYGFTNPNRISVVYLSLILVSVFLHIEFKQRVSFLIMTVSFLLAFKIFLETDSRTSLFGGVFLFFAVLFNFLLDGKYYRQILYYAGFFAPIFGVAATIFIVKFSGTELDTILSLRPYFFSNFISTASFLDIVFGWDDPSNPPVDNLFLTALSAVGVIGLTVIIFFISIRTYKMRADCIPLILIVMVMSIFESFLLRPEIPASVLFVVMLFSPLLQRSKLSNNLR